MARSQQHRMPASDAMEIPVTSLDERRWQRQALVTDIFALVALLLSGAGLGIDLFFAGRLTEAGLGRIEPTTWGIAQLAVECITFLASFAWIAARLLRAGVREGK